jgi:hypothetical protein
MSDMVDQYVNWVSGTIAVILIITAGLGGYALGYHAGDDPDTAWSIDDVIWVCTHDVVDSCEVVISP